MRLQSQEFDLAVFDVRLAENKTDAGGLVLLDVVSQHAPGLAVILISGWTWIEQLGLREDAFPHVRVLAKLAKTAWDRRVFANLVRQEFGLPAATIVTGREAGHERTERRRPRQPNGLGVLVVEDEAEWATLLSDALYQAGYDVIHVASSSAAIPYLYRKREALHAAILDYSLAEGDASNRDGQTLLDDLQAVRLPTIILSGYASQAELTDAVRKYSVVTFTFKKGEGRAQDEDRRTIQKHKYRKQDLLDAVEDAVAATEWGHNLATLTATERNVVRAISTGVVEAPKLAQQFGVAEGTMNNKLRSIKDKLGVNDIASIVYLLDHAPFALPEEPAVKPGSKPRR
ncbi:MAG: hypothetical protein U0641_06680 [Anaerolineae bacterium]